MPSLQHQFFLVPRTHAGHQWLGALRWHQGVKFSDDVQHRHLDLLQIDGFATDAQGTFIEPVPLHQLLVHLPEVRARQWQGLAAEARHPTVALDVVVVPHVVPEPDLAGNTGGRAMGFDHLDDGLCRDDTGRIDQALGLEMTRHGQGHLRPVDRRGETHQVLQRAVGMQRRIQGREHTAHAVADQCDVFDPRVFLHAGDTVRDEVEYIVLQLQVCFFWSRRIPVHDIHVVAASEKEFDQALTLRQVENGSLVGRRHDQ
ncbi:hypothetical protein D9M71_548590 [compost metagenome]